MWIWALASAMGIPCEEIRQMVADDVPQTVVLARLVGSLQDELPTGEHRCFRALQLPPPPPAGAGGEEVYLVELHLRFPCDPSVTAALLTKGFEAPACLEVPGATREYWPASVRAEIRESLRRR